MDDIVPDDDADGAGELLIHAAIVPCRRRVEASRHGESPCTARCETRPARSTGRPRKSGSCCEGTRTIGAIARALGQRYGVHEADLLADVTAAVTTLRARGLVDVSPDAADDAT